MKKIVVCGNCGQPKDKHDSKGFCPTAKWVRHFVISKESKPAIADMYKLLKASRGEQGVNPLKPLGVSVKSGKRQNAGSPRNPESLKK